MRPVILYYCLVQARAADPHRQARREAPARAASRARHAGTPRRGYRARRLPAVAARRVRWAAAAGDRPGSPGPAPAPAAARRPGPMPHHPKGSGARTLAADPPQPR